MKTPELIFVAGPNAAGKSTFIRTRLNELENFTVLMTDVYKGRTKNMVQEAIRAGRDVVIETVFNDSSFAELADMARDAGYFTSLIILFLDDIQQSVHRVAVRSTQQSGITISGSNVKLNFNESFKNIATYFFYFDQANFFYTGEGQANQPVMHFHKSELVTYRATTLTYSQKFAQFGFLHNRLNEGAYQIITKNEDYKKDDIIEPSRMSKLKL